MQSGGAIIQNIKKYPNINDFDLDTFIAEETAKGKELVYISGAGPVGLYCGIELLKTNKYIVIISEQRKSYTRKQIFFIQNTNSFYSYNNLSNTVKKELEKIGCNIGTPFITRTDNCNEYINKYDILNSINSKFISMNAYKLEELFFTEFIFNGGIIIKPDPSINNTSNALYPKDPSEKLVYKFDKDANKIICIEGCKFYNNPKVEINGENIKYIIDAAGLGSGLRKDILNNNRTYLCYKKDTDVDPSKFYGELVEVNEMDTKESMPISDKRSRILSYGLLIYIDISKLSSKFVDKINDFRSNSFGRSKFTPGFPNNVNNEINKRHYIVQNRYRFFATDVDKYKQYYSYFNNIRSDNNSWYASVMLSIEEYDYIKTIFPKGLEIPFDKIINTDNNKYNYFKLLLFSCFNFYGLINTDNNSIDELMNASSFGVFPVDLFYTTDVIARKHNAVTPPVFSIGDSILGVNYFSGTGLNYGMTSVDTLTRILVNDSDIEAKVRQYNDSTTNKKLRDNLTSSLSRFIDFKKINIKNIIEQNFSFTNSDSEQIVLNRILPKDTKPLPMDLNTKLLEIGNFGLNSIKHDNVFANDITNTINELCDWFIEKFAFNIKNSADYSNSFNGIYFNNVKEYLKNNQLNNVFKLYLLLNTLTPFVESNLNNNKIPVTMNTQTLNDLLTIKNFNIIDKNYVTIQTSKPKPDTDYDLDTDYKHEKEKKQEEKSSVYIDPYEKHKQVVTELITNVFLNSDESRYNILNLITEKFNKLIDEYILLKRFQPQSIKFIYKGGNVMRILFESYQQKIGGGFAKLFNEVFAPTFSKSDMDYEILINRLSFPIDDQSFEITKRLIVDDITRLSFYVLDDIRRTMFEDVDKYIDFFKLNPNSQRNSIIETLNKIKRITYENKKLSFLNLQFSNIYSNFNANISSDHHDIHIKNQGANLQIGPIPTPTTHIINKNDFYISVNETIPGFNLFRLKVNLLGLYSKNDDSTNKIYNKNIPGELIDVSISKENKSFTIGEDIVEYKLTKPGDLKLNFTSYTLSYFIKELINIVFVLEATSKTIKRLSRLILLCFIEAHIIDNEKITSKLIDIIEIMKQDINKRQFNINHELMISGYDGFIKFYQHIKLLNNNYNQHIQKINETSVDLLVKINSIISNNITSSLYDISQLGGYKEKYLKYKNKYLQSRK
jgi:hypothetical protein